MGALVGPGDTVVVVTGGDGGEVVPGGTIVVVVVGAAVVTIGAAVVVVGATVVVVGATVVVVGAIVVVVGAAVVVGQFPSLILAANQLLSQGVPAVLKLRSAGAPPNIYEIYHCEVPPFQNMYAPLDALYQ